MGHWKHAIVGLIAAILFSVVAVQKSNLFGLLTDFEGPMFLAYEQLLFTFIADIFIPGVVYSFNKKLRDYAIEELKELIGQ